MFMNLLEQVKNSENAAKVMRTLSTEDKNAALEALAEHLRNHKTEILEANAIDIAEGEKANLGSLLDRMLLDEGRIDAICDDVLNVADLPDSVGQVIEERDMPSGLNIQKVRTPLGVVGMIYEARPNVTVDAAVLALKSGNAIVLKGGSAVINSNRVIVNLMKEALEATKIPAEAIQFIDSTDRAVTTDFLKLKDYIDVLIPRGSKGLIDFVVKESSIPVIETGASVVHVYVDEGADMDKALQIAVNSKTRRVSICNTLDVLLLHKAVAAEFLPKFLFELKRVNAAYEKPLVEVRLGKDLMGFSGDYEKVKELDESIDFDTEYLDWILSVHVVDSFDQAIQHIQHHSLKHSDAIVTENTQHAERFMKEIDSACCYWNASTQFSDGAQFGLGAEIGVSTQKLHVRGPFALEGLTSSKWVVKGDGQIRN